jgi:hypothetical protein
VNIQEWIKPSLDYVEKTEKNISRLNLLSKAIQFPLFTKMVARFGLTPDWSWMAED